MAKNRDDQDQPKKPGKTPPPPPSDDDIDFFEDEDVVEDALEIEEEPPSKKPVPPTMLKKPEEAEEILDAVEAEAADDEHVSDIFAEEAEEVEEAVEADNVLEDDATIAAGPAGPKTPAPTDRTVAFEAGKPGEPEAVDADIFADEVFSDEKAAPASPVPKAEPVEAVEEAIEEAVEEAQEAEAVEEAEEVVEEAVEAEPVAKAEPAPEAEEIVEEAAEAEPVAKAEPSPEAEEVAEAEEAIEEATEAEEAKPVSAASAKHPVSEDDIDLNEIFGDDKAQGEKETVGDFKMDDEAKPVATKAEPAVAEAAPAEAVEEEEPAAVAVATKKAKPTVKPVKPVKPKYFRRWVAGFLLGILTLAGAGAALWYFKPDLLAEAFHSIPESPNGKDIFAKPDPMKSPAVQTALQQKDDEIRAKQGSLDQLTKTHQSMVQDLKKAQAIANAASANTTKLNAAVAKAEQDRKALEAQFNNVVGALVAGKIVQDKDKVDAAAVGKELLELANSKLAVAAINKKLQDAKITEQGEKGVAKLLGSLNDLEKKVNDLDQVLADAKVKGVQDLVDLRKRLETERNELDAMIKAAFKEMVEAKIVAPSADPRKELVAGAKAAGQRSQSPLTSPLSQLASSLSNLATGPVSLLQRGSNMAALTAELAYYRLREPFVQGPEQKLDMWMAELVEPGRSSPTELATAAREAAWLRSKDSRANAETRAKSLVVAGLVHRNEGRFAEALKTLQSAAAEVQTNKLGGAWTAQLNKALDGLANPTAYFMPRLETLLTSGNLKGAIAELDAAIKALPNDGRLLALRSQIQLDSAAGSLSETLKKQIQQDLAAARKDPRAAAEAAFALGRLEEETGNLDEAEKLYRQALQAHKGSDDEAARYRIALARLLQRDRTLGGVAPVAPAPRKVEPKKAPEPKVGQRHDPQLLASVLLLAIVGVQQQDDEELSPAAAARLEESIKLAKDLIKSADPRIKAKGHMLLGQGLAKQGRRTEGLKEYIRGLEILTPGASSQELSKMVEEHPAFQQPDTLARPNPALAEHHFGKGMGAYWSRDYPRAEEHFKQAVSYYSQDARYQYFLGLSQLAQRTKLKRDAAYHAFEQGARLEAMNRPPLSDINASLERLQGDLRQFLNTFRSKK